MYPPPPFKETDAKKSVNVCGCKGGYSEEYYRYTAQCATLPTEKEKRHFFETMINL